MPQSSQSLRRPAFTLGMTTAALLLVGCSAPAEPVDQSLAVTYLDGGQTVDASVDLPQVTCSDLAGTLLYAADGENGDEDWGLLTASATPDSDVYSISIGLGDGLWFISTDAYGAEASQVDLDSLAGIVAPVTFDNGVGSVGEAVDTAATASGVIQCTDD